jgi:thiamine kinase-like enzyme
LKKQLASAHTVNEQIQQHAVSEIADYEQKLATAERAYKELRQGANDHIRGLEKKLEATQFTTPDTRQEANNEIHSLKKKLQAERAANEVLKQQAAEFKAIISTTSQVQGQVSDDVIREKFDQVFFSIQDFVAKTFRKITFGKLVTPVNTDIHGPNLTLAQSTSASLMV